jgi:arsenate reductase
MAEGIIKSFDPSLEVFSAGTKPEKSVNPFAIRVMKEIGIDISTYVSKNVSIYLGGAFDYVITVCDNAKESCPVFTGKVKHRLHMGFEDPAAATGDEETVIKVYRNVRDQIYASFKEFYSGL